MMPLPRRVRQQARIEGLNPDVWDEDGYVVIDPDINTYVGRIYAEN
jgi:hypothetical protein